MTADDGVRLWAESGGEGEEMMLLHGGPGLWDYLGPLAASLEDDHTVVRYDQRGAGRSDHTGPYSLDRFVADCEDVRAEVSFERPVVAGHSWGAALALLYALSHPERVRGVLYIAGIGFDWPRWRATFHHQRLARLTPEERARALELQHRHHLSFEEQREMAGLTWFTDYLDRGTAEEHVRPMLGEGFSLNRDSNRLLSRQLDSTPAATWYQRLRSVTCPVLVVQGDADPRPLRAVDGMVEALPRCERVVLPASHYPWIEDPVGFQQAVGSWLDAL